MTHAFIDKLGFVPQAEDLADVISDADKKFIRYKKIYELY